MTERETLVDLDGALRLSLPQYFSAPAERAVLHLGDADGITTAGFTYDASGEPDGGCDVELRVERGERNQDGQQRELYV